MRPDTRTCERCLGSVIVVWSNGGDRLTLNVEPTFPPHEHTYTGNADGIGWHRSGRVNRAGALHHELHRLQCRPMNGGH